MREQLLQAEGESKRMRRKARTELGNAVTWGLLWARYVRVEEAVEGEPPPSCCSKNDSEPSNKGLSSKLFWSSNAVHFMTLFQLAGFPS